MSNPSETQAQQVVVNKMTQAQFDQITPSATEFYVIVDANASAGDIDNSTITLNNTSKKIQTAAVLNDRDKSTPIKIWEGTKAQYDALNVLPGDTWSAAAVESHLDGYDWCSLAYGNGKFVTISEYNYISTSTDGTTWTQYVYNEDLAYAGTDGYWRGLSYGGEKFVALNTASYISTSTNGTTWTQAKNATASPPLRWLPVPPWRSSPLRFS